MAQIQRVILFVSTNSAACQGPITMVSSSGAPIEIVRLDSRESRVAASRGKHFQITNVPSLVTMFTDGKLQLFVGTDRIFPVLQSLLSPPSPPEEDEILEEEIDLIEQPSPPRKRSTKGRRPANKPKPSSRRKKKTSPPPPPPEDDDDDDDGIEMFGEDPVEELEFEDTNQIAYRPPPPPTTGLMVGPTAASTAPSKNSSIMEIAKRMQRDREATLGYNENDPPKGRF